MKNTKQIILATLLLVAAGLGSCNDWTLTEPIDQQVSTPQEQDPAAYAAYTAKIRAYKQSKHKIFIAAFDNIERPTTPGQMLSMLPDSTDFIVLRNPEKLSAADAKGMRTVQQDFATRVLYSLAPTQTAEQALSAATAGGYDGFMVPASAPAEVIAKLSAAAGPGKGKLLVLEGASANLAGDQHALFDYNVLGTSTAGTTFEVKQQVDFARAAYAFTDDQIVLASSVSATITDNEFVKRDMLSAMLALVVDLGPLGGLAVTEIQNDYYHVGGNFLSSRKAINQLNQLN